VPIVFGTSLDETSGISRQREQFGDGVISLFEFGCHSRFMNEGWLVVCIGSRDPLDVADQSSEFLPEGPPIQVPSPVQVVSVSCFCPNFRTDLAANLCRQCVYHDGQWPRIPAQGEQ